MSKKKETKAKATKTNKPIAKKPASKMAAQKKAPAAPKKPAKASVSQTSKSATQPLQKPSIISQVPAKHEFDDKSKLQELFAAWYETTLGNDKVSYDEVFHRLGTLFRTSCSEFDVSAPEAFELLEHIGMHYAEDVEYVCEDCQAEINANESDKKTSNKLLN